MHQILSKVQDTKQARFLSSCRWFSVHTKYQALFTKKKEQQKER